MFNVHAEDYADQQVILYNTVQYDVARVYAKGEGIIELNCTVREVGLMEIEEAFVALSERICRA